MNQKISIKKERKIITYSELWRTSGYLLDLGLKDERGSYFMFLASLMFSAFSFEAFLNHIGEHLFSTWIDIEKLSPKSKLNILCEKLAIEQDYGKMPWQIVPEIIGFRNKVAHGKNVLLKYEEIVQTTDEYEKILHKFMFAEWQEYVNSDNAIKVRKHLEDLLSTVHAAVGIEDDFLFSYGGQSGSASLITE
jgi:hypothetical protein